MWVVPRLIKKGDKSEKERNNIGQSVLEHILEAVIENWKLGASDVQLEEVTGAQGRGR